MYVEFVFLQKFTCVCMSKYFILQVLLFLYTLRLSCISFITTCTNFLFYVFLMIVIFDSLLTFDALIFDANGALLRIHRNKITLAWNVHVKHHTRVSGTGDDVKRAGCVEVAIEVHCCHVDSNIPYTSNQAAVKYCTRNICMSTCTHYVGVKPCH